ncbi:uncharacterized protein LOC128226258 [Mya arenaria]|uniref:uncharacterized protein LOC128226258 n=1 Tax=Mya arenaria TaxID=6604 RepID=UPI0022E0C1CB|nr:uncharacterized protein LOC128226258 [Mya arenaria]
MEGQMEHRTASHSRLLLKRPSSRPTPKGSPTVLTVYSFDVRPNPVVFPGELHVTLDLTVNQTIDQLFIDVEIWKKTSFGDSKVPCVGDTSIGSCKNIDACGIIFRMWNGFSGVITDRGIYIQIFLAALSHLGQCPIYPMSLTLQNKHIVLPDLPSRIRPFAIGDFRVVFRMKDDPIATENIGCLEFNTGIRQNTDPVVGR